MKEAQDILKLFFWTVETIWLGHVAAFRLIRKSLRVPRLFADTGRCPRGHVVPLHGVYECKCRALIEGYVFDSCPVCGQSAGWTPCWKCGLPVRNPWL